MGAFAFELLAVDGAARRGRIRTAHGMVDTPAFMPVATLGSVKSLSPGDVRAAGAQIVLSNTYHLFLRPGHELVREMGGLHRFMGWDGPILTDSGGFQVWSLAALRRLGEDGVEFRSHVDGSRRVLTPELSIEIQQALGVDIIHPLDECLGHPATEAETERSLALTQRWLRRSAAAHARGPGGQALFGIVQGGVYPALRRRAVEDAAALDLPGYAIGGLAVGEPKPVLLDIAAVTTALLPKDRPRYLMGVGKPPDLVEAVACGVDCFDCALPTRNARNGQVFTADGPLAIRNARFARDAAPLEAECPCEACRGFSRAYLRHLFMARELLAYRLLSLHNITFYQRLVAAMRVAIAESRFDPFRTRFLDRYGVESHAGRDGVPSSDDISMDGEV
ncbi:MAG TPA: tRNA guanosine(34) transglycosylase Tgt [Verrucomicrobiae bacterium]|jgi:queuine tRNA-ribosyltransferase|nr:tRNA guanosine(34) transglycosylase Tgt [Verrucomicrobiae bacterium]